VEVFVLDSPKLNEIIYNMENQKKKSVILISTGEVLLSEELETVNGDNVYPLPEWGPVDGFRIMNEFVSSLKNPIVKEELKHVLNLGHGVFRKFKNVLKSSPEIEKLWYSYKRDEIKAKVLNWYNQIREYAGLELFENEDLEDDEDLLDFDFTVTSGNESDFDFIRELDSEGFIELYSNYPKDVAREIYNKKREGLFYDSMFDSDLIYTAQNASGEKVGFIWAANFSVLDSFYGMELLQLYVIPEYRGLGIGKLLLNKILQDFREGEYNEFQVSCQGRTSWLIKYLELEGYKIAFQELSFRL